MSNVDTGGRIRATAPSGGGAALPSGVVVAWFNSATPPTGYVNCDGSNGTDDLRGKFLRGTPAGGTVGDTGGAASHLHQGGAHDHDAGTLYVPTHGHGHSLTMPSHNHNVDWCDLDLCYTTAACGFDVCVLNYASIAGITTQNASGESINGDIDLSGNLGLSGTTASGGAVDTTSASNLPPYEDVLWIMKV